MKKPWVLSYPLSAQQRLWSDWVDAQADLSLRWVHRHFLSCCGSFLAIFFPYFSRLEFLQICYILFFADCKSDKMLADTTLHLLKGYGPKAVMMHKFLTLMPPKHHNIPMWECDADGKYNEIQKMLMIPVMKDATNYTVCVNTATGQRIENTPIVFEESMQPQDCKVRQDIDAACKYLRVWAWENQHNDLCAQRRLRSAWASVQSVQSLWFVLWVAKADPSLRWAHRLFC